jgi:hypothetical protein
MLDPHWAILIGQLSERVTKLERAVNHLKKDVRKILRWGNRLALIAALWTTGVAGNLLPEEKAELVRKLLGLMSK